MSESQHRLPPEIVDYIIDLLHDDPEALKKCCFVSKSWVERSRIHLFNKFDLGSLKTWRATFPLRSFKSFAHRVRSLRVDFTGVSTEDAEDNDWIQSFTHVVRLNLFSGYPVPKALFFPFHVLSSLKALTVRFFSFPTSEVLKLIYSCPLLEDLDISIDVWTGVSNDDGAIFQPSTSPPLTGTLNLSGHQPRKIVHSLLDFPGGPHFRKISWGDGSVEVEPELVTALVERCSGSLEFLDMNFVPVRKSRPSSSRGGSGI